MSEVESRDEEFIGGVITDTHKAKDTTKTVQSVDGIIRKDTLTVVSFGSCGHVLRSVNDVGGKCLMEDCENIPCSQCFRLCARCQKGLCNRHQKLRRGVAYCNKCRWIVFFIGSSEDGHQVR